MGIIVDVNLLEEDGKQYLKIYTPPQPSPVNYNGEYHYRIGSTKQQLTGQALNNFLINKTGFKWDATIIKSATFDDIDLESVNIFKQNALKFERMSELDLNISLEDLFNKLNLLQNGMLKKQPFFCLEKTQKVS